MQLRIIEVMKYLTSEAKPYVSEILIKNKINSYYQAYNRSFSNQVIKSQLTRMVNDDIICKKRNSYAILASFMQIVVYTSWFPRGNAKVIALASTQTS